MRVGATYLFVILRRIQVLLTTAHPLPEIVSKPFLKLNLESIDDPHRLVTHDGILLTRLLRPKHARQVCIVGHLFLNHEGL